MPVQPLLQLERPEHLEQLWLHRVRDPDSRVRHRDRDQLVRLALLVPVQRLRVLDLQQALLAVVVLVDDHADRPSFRELQGVAQQVHQDLLDPVRVRVHQAVGHVVAGFDHDSLLAALER